MKPNPLARGTPLDRDRIGPASRLPFPSYSTPSKILSSGVGPTKNICASHEEFILRTECERRRELSSAAKNVQRSARNDLLRKTILPSWNGDSEGVFRFRNAVRTLWPEPCLVARNDSFLAVQQTLEVE